MSIMTNAENVLSARREALDEAIAMIGEMKVSTDGPRRDDWQLGYAAACREIAARVRMLKNS